MSMQRDARRAGVGRGSRLPMFARGAAEGRGPRRARPGVEALERRTVPTNILFFGNSFTYLNDAIRVDTLVKEVAAAAGQAAPFTNLRAPGGTLLSQHAAAVDANAVRALVPAGVADVVVLQGQSREAASRVSPLGVSDFRRGAVDLVRDVRAAFPNARIVLYETWAREGWIPEFYPSPYANPAAMQADLYQGYVSALNDLRGAFGRATIDLAPVGEAFRKLGFHGSLYVPSDTNSHPSVRGILLAALTIYATAYDDNVSDIPWTRAATLLGSRGLGAADWQVLTAAADQAIGDWRSTLNRTFVRQAFLDILGRQANLDELNYFAGRLSSGASTRVQVAQVLTSSDEYRAKFIQGRFQFLLGRGVDAAGVNYFLQQMRSGMSADVVRATILGSDEFFARAGGTNDRFIRALFDKVLHRVPSNADVGYWLGRMAAGVDRARVVWGFVNSPENRSRQVADLYRPLLRRPADPAGLNFFAGALLNGARFEDVVSALTGTYEYYLRLV